jgi:hypothetical protein
LDEREPDGVTNVQSLGSDPSFNNWFESVTPHL